MPSGLNIGIMKSQKFVHAQLKNGMLVFKCNNFSILSCEFKQYHEDVKPLIYINAAFMTFPRATKIKKIKDLSKTKINVSSLPPDEIKRESFEREILVPLNKDFTSPYVTIVLPFRNILTLLFGDIDHVNLFLYYLSNLLFFNTNEKELVNPLSHLIILNDTHNVVKKLIGLLVPNFEEIGSVSNILMFEKESWKKNNHLQTLMNSAVIMDHIKMTAYSAKNSIITHESIQYLNIFIICNSNLNINLESEYSKYKYANILLFLLTTTVNDFKVTEEIKNKYLNDLTTFFKSLIC